MVAFVMEGDMRKVACRTALVLVIVMFFVAAPSFAQYPGCQQCGGAIGSEAGMLYCVDVDGWGWETCNVVVRNGFATCRTSGFGCYAMEVRG
ncbi:MAG: hypothetical protein QOI24_2471 [Acidobacteriota bacterium]|jgi:hypothetical protein|nr:hypothetical protein [Acidobacteriota bacterium]